MAAKAYTFSEGWKEGFFNLNALKVHDRKDTKYLRLYGLCAASSSYLHEKSGGNNIELSVNTPELVEYFRAELKKEDCTITVPRDGHRRPRIYVWNKALMYHYVEPLPSLDPQQRTALLQGVLSKAVGDTATYSCRKRDTGRPKHDKAIFITRNPRFAFEARLAASMRPNILPWYVYDRGESLGTWFPDPEALKPYMLFDECKTITGRLHRFDSDEIALDVSSLNRAALYEQAKTKGVLPVTAYQAEKLMLTELHKESRRLRHERSGLESRRRDVLRKLNSLESFEEDRSSLKREKTALEAELGRLEKRHAEYQGRIDGLYKQIHGRPLKKRNGDNSYGRRQWDHIKARQTAGEV